MNKPPPADNFCASLNRTALAVCLSLLAALFCACSEDPVSVSFTQSIFVLDWQNDQDPPSQRLAVFMTLDSNPRRLESFSVRNSNYVWNVDSPILFLSGDRQWAGASRLEPPPAENGESGNFDFGAYSVECVDAAGKTDQGTFSIGFNRSLLEATADKVSEIIPTAALRVAVYSESNELLYYDAPKDDWDDDARVFKSVKSSSYFRRSYVYGNLICFMPKIYKDGEKPDELE